MRLLPLLAFTLACLFAFAPAFAADKPNIVFIMADDLGYGDLGVYGQKKIKTPHIDKLASQGMKFTDYYAGSTVCAPSRSVLMRSRNFRSTTGAMLSSTNNRLPAQQTCP